ncbi:MAG TPA: zf-HC2 domain-containing protein [Gemmatimonadales bacterium]|nr:zf-HC2 domain-containing protein [Gemmatimonadales bacterium]
MTQQRKEDSMSHVDEGALHAYLDGELPSAERAALEAHIAQCESCRAQLVEERALLDRANALLGAARPVERPVPSFEQLRRARQRSPWRVRTPVAWAASIVLALGFGYYLASMRAYRVAPEAAAPIAVATDQRLADKARDSAEVPQARRLAREEKAERPRATPEDERAFGQAVALGRVDSGALKVATSAEPLNNARPPETPQPTSGVARQREADSLAASDRATSALPSAPAARMQQQDVLTVRKPSANTWPRIDRQTATAILGEDPVGLPDLTTRTFRRSPDRDGIVVVEQELDARTVIQIFQQSARANSSRIDSLVAEGYLYHLEADRRDRLARFVGKLRVEIGGPVSVDSLNRLLEQVGRLP